MTPQKKDQPDVAPSVEENTKANESRHEDAPKETPGGFHPDDARASVAEGKTVEAPIGDPLSGLSREELVRLRTAVESTLDGWGADPEDPPASRGPSIRETASDLPPNPAATKGIDRSKAAKHVEADEDDVLDFGVRQAGATKGDEDTGHGPAFLQVVLKDGRKQVVKL